MFITQCNNCYHSDKSWTFRKFSVRGLTRSHVGERGRGKIFKVDKFEIVLNCKEREKYTPYLFQPIKKRGLCRRQSKRWVPCRLTCVLTTMLMRSWSLGDQMPYLNT